MRPRHSGSLCRRTAPGLVRTESFGIDTTGDGKIDTLLVDTTGDGKLDTQAKAKEVDSTGDGRLDTLLIDATGDGEFDTVEQV